MPNNKTSTLIDELGQAIRTIDGTGDFTFDLSDASKMFYQMDRPDFERIAQADFPRVLILIKDLQADEMLNNFNELSMQVNIVMQYKDNDVYNATLADGQKPLNACYDIRRGIRAWQQGLQDGTYEANWEITSAATQEIGRNDRLITIETIFSAHLEEEF